MGIDRFRHYSSWHKYQHKRQLLIKINKQNLHKCPYIISVCFFGFFKTRDVSPREVSTLLTLERTSRQVLYSACSLRTIFLSVFRFVLGPSESLSLIPTLTHSHQRGTVPKPRPSSNFCFPLLLLFSPSALCACSAKPITSIVRTDRRTRSTSALSSADWFARSNWACGPAPHECADCHSAHSTPNRRSIVCEGFLSELGRNINKLLISGDGGGVRQRRWSGGGGLRPF